MACGDCSITTDTKRFFILLSLLGIYLLAGAAVFQALENEQEAQEILDLNKLREHIMSKYNLTLWEFDVLVKKIERAWKHRCDQNSNEWCSSQWTYYASLYFTVSVVTTIGYGHLAPTTDGGRLFCMIFALLGIPMHMMIMQHVGRTITGLIHSWLRHLDKTFFNREIKRLKIKTLLVTVVLMVSALMIGGMMYTLTEDWTYLEGVYYCFITFSTIGFGDLVPNHGMAPEGHYETLIEVARAVLVVLGLSLLFSVISSVLIASDELRITFPKLIGKGDGYEPLSSPGERQTVIMPDDDDDDSNNHMSGSAQGHPERSSRPGTFSPNLRSTSSTEHTPHDRHYLSPSHAGRYSPSTRPGTYSPNQRSAPPSEQTPHDRHNMSPSLCCSPSSLSGTYSPNHRSVPFSEHMSHERHNLSQLPCCCPLSPSGAYSPNHRSFPISEHMSAERDSLSPSKPPCCLLSPSGTYSPNHRSVPFDEHTSHGLSPSHKGHVPLGPAHHSRTYLHPDHCLNSNRFPAERKPHSLYLPLQDKIPNVKQKIRNGTSPENVQSSKKEKHWMPQEIESSPVVSPLLEENPGLRKNVDSSISINNEIYSDLHDEELQKTETSHKLSPGEKAEEKTRNIKGSLEKQNKTYVQQNDPNGMKNNIEPIRDKLFNKNSSKVHRGPHEMQGHTTCQNDNQNNGSVFDDDNKTEPLDNLSNDSDKHCADKTIGSDSNFTNDKRHTSDKPVNRTHEPDIKNTSIQAYMGS